MSEEFPWSVSLLVSKTNQSTNAPTNRPSNHFKGQAFFSTTYYTVKDFNLFPPAFVHEEEDYITGVEPEEVGALYWRAQQDLVLDSMWVYER